MRLGWLGLISVLVLALCLVGETDAWSGNTYRILRRTSYQYSYCACWYRWWGCSYYRYRWVTRYYYETRCLPGWTHNGNYNCVIPICRPYCANGGTCIRPNVCSCPTTSQGPGCRQLTCSYKRPCYPGDCQPDQTCKCEPGFKSARAADGCIIFEDTFLESSNSTLAPVIGKSMVTLAHIRRSDGKTNFEFVMDGTETNFTDVIWSNQMRFNNLRFEFESLFVQPDGLPERPAYIHDAKLGVVHSQIEANVSKIARDKGPIRDAGSFKTYVCKSGFSRDNPAVEKAECEINDEQFVTLIEHGDWLTVTFQTTSGGFQKLINLDNQGLPYATKYYTGLKDIKQVEFKFDFIAPRHCTENNPFNTGACNNNAHILKVDKEFTKTAIRATWSGWQDDLSGMWEYFVEIFRLSPDPYGRLVEMTPLTPVVSQTIPHSAGIAYPVFTPSEPGMYSVLVEFRDVSNNSRIARRLVLFDDKSTLELSDAPDRKLYVSSAEPETGYSWQTMTTGTSSTFVVNWENHFINRIHADGNLLNAVQPYPTQFKDIEDDGVLFSRKYVNESLDDNEGQRTRAAIANFNGIVKFEMAKEFTQSTDVPTVGWSSITPLSQNTSFTAQIDNGARVRVWIRATDVMGNKATDSTMVRVDSTPPLISDDGVQGAEHGVVLNTAGGMYNYTSRISFVATDDESGVYKLGFNIIIHTPGKADRTVFTNSTEARIGSAGNPLCRIIDAKCFIPQQQMELNNCWFLVNKADLQTSTATVEVLAYNQALLYASAQFEIGNITQLNGLETYSGPTSIIIKETLDNGFILTWDLPEKSSCYGVADIVILITRQTENGLEVVKEYVVLGTQTRLDVLGLEAQTEYDLSLGLRVPGGGELQNDGTTLSVTTLKTKDPSPGIPIALIIGIVVGLLVLFILAIILLVVLARRGVIKPAEKARRIRSAVQSQYRKTVYGTVGASHAKKPQYGYNNRQSELYIYGGMDEGPQIWHLERDNIALESLIKSGHFANIYQAKLMTGGTSTTVVAKTLKEGYTAEDEMLMKAKLNFTGTIVGDHPNVLKFIGAVVSDEALGPFIIYEFCENGTLKEFVEKHKRDVTIEFQDSLYRFGLDIAKGMEYLAGKGVVHRRLAARNILLTFLNEVKISGFGPQPLEEEDGTADQGKKERIPIKWMAPECMTSTTNATEKSDVWSYGVLLWEMFSMGEVPYSNIRSRDLAARIKKGERLPKPEHCDDTWYGTMRKCWAFEESKRPVFSDIRSQLDTLFVASDDDLYYYQR